MKSRTILSLFLGISLISNIVAEPDVPAIREGIAARAELQVGCAYWSNAAYSGSGPNTNKNNYFVYDIGNLALAGAKMPEVSEGVPIGAGVGGWGTLSTLKNWTLVNDPQRGDIVAARDPIDNTYHVGIFISTDTTISTNPQHIIRSNWPFGTGSEEGEDIRSWKYCGLEENCP